jgi:SnoaL-like polyketide cyclase
MGAEEGTMSANDDTHVFRRLIEEGFNGGRLAVLDELLTADFVDHSPCQKLGGAGELRERIALLRVALPDLHVCIEQLAAADNMTWAAVTIRGTARPVPGFPAIDECLDFSRVETCRYVNGRIAE